MSEEDNSIVLGILYHGGITDRKINDVYNFDKNTLSSLYWHSLVPVNGCLNYLSEKVVNTFDTLNRAYKIYRKINDSAHKNILKNYCKHTNVENEILLLLRHNYSAILTVCEQLAAYAEEPEDIPPELTELIDFLKLYIQELTDIYETNKYNDTVLDSEEKLGIIVSISDELIKLIHDVIGDDISDIQESYNDIIESTENARKLKQYYSEQKSNCGRFLRIKYDKEYGLDEKNKQNINEIIGVYVIYDSKNPSSKLHKHNLFKGEFNLSDIIFTLIPEYKKVYIYDYSCNYSEKLFMEDIEKVGSRTTSSKARSSSGVRMST